MREIPISLDERKIERFCRKYHIVYLALFGSILTSNFSEKSDIDILVRFEKKHDPHLFSFAGIESELSEIIGREVDLKTPNDLNPLFRGEVLAKAKTIYGK